MCWGLPGGSVVKNPSAHAGDGGLITKSGTFPGGGNGSPLQYSCLENFMDRGAWRGTVCGVAKSRTWLRTKHSKKRQRRRWHGETEGCVQMAQAGVLQPWGKEAGRAWSCRKQEEVCNWAPPETPEGIHCADSFISYFWPPGQWGNIRLML